MTMTRRDLPVGVRGACGDSGFSAQRMRARRLPREADIVVIGAGAAGIAAARRIMAANRKVIVVEAASQIGGRCLTDTATFERAVRSRRALDAQSRDQSDDQARARRGARDHDRAARARRSASAAATRAPARPRNFSPRWCAPTAPSTKPRGKADVSCAVGAAEGPRRLGGHGGVRARRQFRGQGSEGRLRRSTRPARRTAMPRSPAARAWAR